MPTLERLDTTTVQWCTTKMFTSLWTSQANCEQSCHWICTECQLLVNAVVCSSTTLSGSTMPTNASGNHVESEAQRSLASTVVIKIPKIATFVAAHLAQLVTIADRFHLASAMVSLVVEAPSGWTRVQFVHWLFPPTPILILKMPNAFGESKLLPMASYFPSKTCQTCHAIQPTVATISLKFEPIWAMWLLLGDCKNFLSLLSCKVVI